MELIAPTGSSSGHFVCLCTEPSLASYARAAYDDVVTTVRNAAPTASADVSDEDTSTTCSDNKSRDSVTSCTSSSISKLSTSTTSASCAHDTERFEKTCVGHTEAKMVPPYAIESESIESLEKCFPRSWIKRWLPTLYAKKFSLMMQAMFFIRRCGLEATLEHSLHESAQRNLAIKQP